VVPWYSNLLDDAWASTFLQQIAIPDVQAYQGGRAQIFLKD
jgi:hypothetical protein